jgi:hypothetical protein
MFDELITPEEREEIERAFESINRMLIKATMLAANITDFIDARFDGKA